MSLRRHSSSPQWPAGRQHPLHKKRDGLCFSETRPATMPTSDTPASMSRSMCFAPRRADTSLSPVGLLASQLHKMAHGNAPLRSAPGLHPPGHQQFEQPACANRTSSIERHQCPDSHPWPGASRFRNRAHGFTGLSALTARPSGYGSALSMLRRSSCAATRAGTFGRTPRADPSSRNAGSDDQRVGDGPGVRSAAR